MVRGNRLGYHHTHSIETMGGVPVGQTGALSELDYSMGRPADPVQAPNRETVFVYIFVRAHMFLKISTNSQGLRTKNAGNRNIQMDIS